MEQNINIGPNPTPEQAPNMGGRPAEPQQPAPPQGYPAPAEPVQSVKQRRVGTFTLGIALIMIGIMVPLSMIYQERAMLIFRFAPAILIILGVEVLYYAIRYKESKLRYDGLSIFLVIMMTVITLIASTVTPFVSNTYAYSKQERELRIETRTQMTDVIDELGYEGSVNCYGSYYSDFGFFEVIDGVPEDAITMNAHFSLDDIGAGRAPTKEQAAEAMTKILQAATERNSRLEEVSITVNSGSNEDYYSISLYRTQLNNVTRESVEKRIRTHAGYDDGSNNEYYEGDESSVPEEVGTSSEGGSSEPVSSETDSQ